MQKKCEMDSGSQNSRNDGFSKTLEKKIQRKQKRLQHMISKETGIECYDIPKKNLIVCNAGLTTGLDETALLTELMQFGTILDIRLLPRKSYCFVICTNETEAARIYQSAHARSLLGQHGSPVYLTYCDRVPDSHESTSVTFEHLAGLLVVEDYITEAEEQQLIDLVKWDDESVTTNSKLKHRQARHFGYEFRYDTNNVDTNQPLINEQIPSECDFLWANDNLSRVGNQFIERPQQLTVNKYEPGQGIPPHVDTHSAFKDEIISLSLGSDVVMEFRKPHPTNDNEYEKHVSVRLPRRSLLVMSGEARYGWKHSITPRKIDIVQSSDGHLTAKFRDTRLSYTFRWLSDKPCHCEYHSLCDSYKKQNEKENDAAIIDPTKCELENVHQVYNEIANHFSETRHSPWPRVSNFLQRFDVGSVLVDVGCGNGKYLDSKSNIFKIGCDRSDGLLGVCRERNFNVFQCDCLAVPIKSESVDGCYSIAVIHHLASEDRRIRAIKEMIRILRIDGLALIYVWAKNQAFKTNSNYLKQNKRNDNDCNTTSTQSINSENKSDDFLSLPIHTNRTQFAHSDVLVPWKLKQSLPACNNDTTAATNDKSAKTFLRYYHVFDENELFALCSQFDNIDIEDSYYDQGNWCIIMRKTAK